MVSASRVMWLFVVSKGLKVFGIVVVFVASIWWLQLCRMLWSLMMVLMLWSCVVGSVVCRLLVWLLSCCSWCSSMVLVVVRSVLCICSCMFFQMVSICWFSSVCFHSKASRAMWFGMVLFRICVFVSSSCFLVVVMSFWWLMYCSTRVYSSGVVLLRISL